MNRVQGSLCQRLAREALLLLLAFQLLVFTIGGVLVVWPLLRTATGDLAAVMQEVARHWRDTLPASGQRVDDTHALVLQREAPAGLRPALLPYARELGNALARRALSNEPVMVDPDGHYWAHLIQDNGAVWIGFEPERLGTRPPLVLLLSGLALVALAPGYGLLVAGRLNRPLRTLTQASERLGQGDTGVRVPETGPLEIAVLGQAFNTLAGRLQELLNNRATLLVGLSHDLRTPLTRLRLSLEMIEGEDNAGLRATMARDIEALNELLDSLLALERGLHLEQGRRVPVSEVLEDVVRRFRQDGHPVLSRISEERGPVSELALRRVCENLLANALRYGGDGPVEVELARDSGDRLRLRISDRGPGIPEDQREAVLRPFHRLESSRSSETGGSGLGLAIVQQICRVQNWRLALGGRPGGGLVAEVVIPESPGSQA